MGAAIKPQFYISYIPDGKINIAPQIWASIVFVPHVEKATADTLRNVSKVETFSADTIRKIGNAENTHADLNRNVKNLEKAVADTARKMGVVFATADTCRAVKNIDSATADSLRRIGVTETVQADSLRKVAVSEKVSADTFLKITATEKAVADTCRRMLERASADTCRKVSRAEKVFADTVIRYPHILNFIAQDSLINTFKDYGLSLFEVTLSERTLSDTFALETARQIDINDAVKGTFLDYPYSFLVEETTQQDLFTSVKGMYDVDKLLYSYVKEEIDYTDEYIEAVKLINEQIKKNPKGYYHTNLISVAEDFYDLIYVKADVYVSKIAEYFGLTPNVKIDNFTPSNISEDTKFTYSDLISNLFSWTSKLPQRQINVFIRGDTLHCIQRGKEDSVFDISDIPHSRPNVNKKLIRTLYNNPNKVAALFVATQSNSTSGDDSPTPTPTPTPKPDDEDTPTVDPEYLPEEVPYPYSGTMRYADDDENVYLTYSGGLLIQEGVSTKNSQQAHSQTTSYSYIAYGELKDGDDGFQYYTNIDWYLKNKFVKNTALQKDDPEDKAPSTKIVTTSETVYVYKKTYGDIYLRKEREVSTKLKYSLSSKGGWILDDRDTSTRATYHTPVGNGFYATSVYVDGEIQGSSISQGKPGNKVSLFTFNEVQWALSPTNPKISNNGGNNNGGDSGGGDSGGGDSDDKDKNTEPGLSPIDETIFPVREIELQNELVEALKWLNRKIQVTVTVDLIDKIQNGVPTLKHVVDFTERVKLDGEEYFLVSNKISFTPRKLIQSLQLVRWTE